MFSNRPQFYLGLSLIKKSIINIIAFLKDTQVSWIWIENCLVEFIRNRELSRQRHRATKVVFKKLFLI